MKQTKKDKAKYMRKYRKTYLTKDKIKMIKNQRAGYYKKHSKKINSHTKKYYRNNKEIRKEYGTKYYTNNKGTMRVNQTEYYMMNSIWIIKRETKRRNDIARFGIKEYKTKRTYICFNPFPQRIRTPGR